MPTHDDIDFTKTLASRLEDAMGVSPLPETDGEYLLRVETESHDDIDLAMFDLPTRPGPARAATAPEQDPTEKRLAREVEAAPYIADNVGIDGDHDDRWMAGRCAYISLGSYDGRTVSAVEVKHSSGKVKV